MFAAASLLCGLAGSYEVLIVAHDPRLRAAFALAGAVPVLAGIRRSDEHTIGIWRWRARSAPRSVPRSAACSPSCSVRTIFLFQAPVAALTLIPIVDRRACEVELPPTCDRPKGNGLANVGFLLLDGAFAGELFLAVLLLVVVWGWSPITGAFVVSAIPLGAIVVRKLGPPLPARFAVVTGGVALAGGLLGSRISRRRRQAGPRPAPFVCGLGLGLLSGYSARCRCRRACPTSAPRRSALPPATPGSSSCSRSLRRCARARSIRLRSTPPRTTAEILDSSIGYRPKIDLAFDLRDLVADTPRGEVPDPSEALRGADDDADLAATRDGVVSAVQDTVTRAFRSSLDGAPVRRGGGGRRVVPARLAIGRAPSGRDRAGERRHGARRRARCRRVPCRACDYGTRETSRHVMRLPTRSRKATSLTAPFSASQSPTINGAACELATPARNSSCPWNRRAASARRSPGPRTPSKMRSAPGGARGRGRRRTGHDPRPRRGALRFAAERAPLDWVLGRFDLPFVEDA